MNDEKPHVSHQSRPIILWASQTWRTLFTYEIHCLETIMIHNLSIYIYIPYISATHYMSSTTNSLKPIVWAVDLHRTSVIAIWYSLQHTPVITSSHVKRNLPRLPTSSPRRMPPRQRTPHVPEPPSFAAAQQPNRRASVPKLMPPVCNEEQLRAVH